MSYVRLEATNDAKLNVHSAHDGIMVEIIADAGSPPTHTVLRAHIRPEDRNRLVNACLGVGALPDAVPEPPSAAALWLKCPECGRTVPAEAMIPARSPLERTLKPDLAADADAYARAHTIPAPVAFVQFQYVFETHFNTAPSLWALDQQGRMWWCNPESEHGPEWFTFPMPVAPA